MASTRNKNTPGNYCMQQNQYKDMERYELYVNSQYGQAYDTRWCGNGLNPGQIPKNMLSSNSVEIESFLFGTGLTNLVNPIKPLVPELNTLETFNVYEKTPVYMPQPLVVEKSQRPLFRSS